MVSGVDDEKKSALEAFVREALTVNPVRQFGDLMAEMKKRFGASLAPRGIAVVRRAMGIEPKRKPVSRRKKRRGRGPGRPPKSAAAAGNGRRVKRGPGRPRKYPLGAPRRGRPPRAATQRMVGADGGFTHIIGVPAGRGLKTFSARSPEDALEKINALLEAGTAPGSIHLFSRSQLAVEKVFKVSGV
ncbi:MAG: hypothetical protein HY719_05665 [Planctomycetes bacterium]|nr:hypothetical protein [Planctomycetota bacterium]